MNKEKMFKNLSNKDKIEVLNLMSFMKKFKEQERKKELYATYEEYLDLIHISEHLNDENENLQSQLDIANKKLDKIKKHCNLSTTYEFNEIKNNHNSFDHQRIINNNNEILSIIGGE